MPDHSTPEGPRIVPEGRRLRPDEPCSHRGCLSHFTHPCEGCGRTAGRYPTPAPVGGEACPRPHHLLLPGERCTDCSFTPTSAEGGERKLWRHCTPGLLASGVDCATTERRDGEGGIGHDHLVPESLPTPTLAATGGEEPKRYNLASEGPFGYMAEDRHGYYVEFADFARLRRQLAEAEEHINALCSTNSDIAREYRGRWQEAEARATTAERRLEDAQQVFAVVADELGVDVEAAPTADEPRSAAEHVRREIVGWKDALTASQQEVARLREALALQLVELGKVGDPRVGSLTPADVRAVAATPNAEWTAEARPLTADEAAAIVNVWFMRGATLSSSHQSTGQGGGV